MTSTLSRWNLLSAADARNEILPCCGSRAWASTMVGRRPITNETVLLAVSDEVWKGLPEKEWNEAFRSHPRIGESLRQLEMNSIGAVESHQQEAVGDRASAWSGQEQQQVSIAGTPERLALAEANHVYEQRFGRIFIICATGKSPDDILRNLHRRLNNDAATELYEAAEEQRMITNLRLRKWLLG